MLITVVLSFRGGLRGSALWGRGEKKTNFKNFKNCFFLISKNVTRLIENLLFIGEITSASKGVRETFYKLCTPNAQSGAMRWKMLTPQRNSGPGPAKFAILNFMLSLPVSMPVYFSILLYPVL